MTFLEKLANWLTGLILAVRGAALASSDARKVDELAARICSYRSAMMPAVTVQIEAQG